MIDWEQIQDRILSLISIEDIINKYTCNKIVRNRTNCINSECSGVQERTMSLQKGYAYCFRCGKNYNQIQAVMEIRNCDYITACKTIINDFGLLVSLNNEPTEKEKREWTNKKKEIEKKKQKEKAMADFAKATNDKIILKLRKCESWKLNNDKIEYANNQKIMSKILLVDNEIARLNWLYCKINDLDCKNYVYELVYPTNKKELLRNIYKGEILI